MQQHLHPRIQIYGQASLWTRAFWACFAALVLLMAACIIVLAVFLGRDTALEAATSPMSVWRAAVACGVLALPSIWLLACWESHSFVRRMLTPIATIIEQCREILDGRSPARSRINATDEALGGLALAINDLLTHFEQSLVRQHRFTADAAHELRTPLTAQSVVGENALSRRCTSAELRETVGSMLEESKHMQRLIESLLQLTRASAATVAENEPARRSSALELGALARGCVESLQVLAEEKHQHIELTAAQVWADADATMVRQALLNVIHNAVEHCPEGTHIHVTTDRSPLDQAMIRVRDDGLGIPLDQQADIFKRFYRRPSASRRRGLGLGLSIAKAFLTSQRGDIQLRSEPGAGCCFTMTLPLLPERSVPRRPTAAPSAGYPAEMSKSLPAGVDLPV